MDQTFRTQIEDRRGAMTLDGDSVARWSSMGVMSGRQAVRILRGLGFTAGLLAVALPTLAAKSAKPDFGANVLIFDPSMPSQAIQKQIDVVYATQRRNEFGPQRNALMFLPGSYSLDVPVGFYTEVMGLGASPDATRIAGIRFHDMITVALGDHGEISHVIDDKGEATAMHPRVTPKVTSFP